MSSVFDQLVGQPRVARFLQAAAANPERAQAYLFCGPLGAGKTEAAQAFAQALLCVKGGCGQCDDCIRIAHGTHPDYQVITPMGAAGYLMEQMRELIHDASLAPVRAQAKVYLITRADLLRGASANSLLKTLEEPPERTTFILLARVRDAMLPTIVSRCQAVTFRRVPTSEAIQALCSSSNASEQDARVALAATGGSAVRAAEWLRSEERRAGRQVVLDVVEKLALGDSADVLDASDKLRSQFKVASDAVKLQQDEQLTAQRDYLSRGALSRLELQQRRELTARERETIGEALDITRSWLRDALGIALGADEPVVNQDHYYNITKAAAHSTPEKFVAALQAVDSAQEQLQYNVSVQMVIEALLMTLQGELR
jgi:DNA polymerase-3 subunit delta'